MPNLQFRLQWASIGVPILDLHCMRKRSDFLFMTVVARVKEFQSQISSADEENWLLHMWRSSAPQCEEFCSSTRHRGCMEEIGSPDRRRRYLKTTIDVNAREFLWSGVMVGVFTMRRCVMVYMEEHEKRGLLVFFVVLVGFYGLKWIFMLLFQYSGDKILWISQLPIGYHPVAFT